MLEMVSITSLDIQREIITCIPEVLDDSEHTEVARKLRYTIQLVDGQFKCHCIFVNFV